MNAIKIILIYNNYNRKAFKYFTFIVYYYMIIELKALDISWNFEFNEFLE